MNNYIYDLAKMLKNVSLVMFGVLFPIAVLLIALQSLDLPYALLATALFFLGVIVLLAWWKK